MAYDEDLAERLRELLAGKSGITEKKMFGGLAFLVGGHMSVTASRDGGLMVRCDPGLTDRLLGEAHVRPFVMRGRELDGWLRVDPPGYATDSQLRRWVDLGLGRADTL
jgi:TfoX/Sxy family transcriptional regulator of competence genes